MDEDGRQCSDQTTWYRIPGACRPCAVLLVRIRCYLQEPYYRNDVARLCRIMVASTRGLICRKGRGLISFKFKKREVVDIFGTAVAIVT